MITAYLQDGATAAVRLDDGRAPPADAVWIDALSPSAEEIATIEQALGVELPSRQAMLEIEPSSRLYDDAGVLFMTAPLLAGVEAPSPAFEPFTFVLTERALVTLHYIESRPVQIFLGRAARDPRLLASGRTVFAGLLDAVVDRLADVLEHLAGRIDVQARRLFPHRRSSRDGREKLRRTAAPPPPPVRFDLRALLEEIGAVNELIAHARDSIAALDRLTSFATAMILKPNALEKRRLKTASRDLAGLAQHADYQSARIVFMLDAALGLIAAEENNLTRVFSIGATAFLPPTLIASIYGMNFEHMPELGWPFGYPLAILAMIASGVGPLIWFHRKGWL